jgi:hypothetical protein
LLLVRRSLSYDRVRCQALSHLHTGGVHWRSQDPGLLVAARNPLRSACVASSDAVAVGPECVRDAVLAQLARDPCPPLRSHAAATAGSLLMR